MAGMDPETGFMTEAKKLFKDEKVVYIKVAKAVNPYAGGSKNGRILRKRMDLMRDI